MPCSIPAQEAVDTSRAPRAVHKDLFPVWGAQSALQWQHLCQALAFLFAQVPVALRDFKEVDDTCLTDIWVG